MSFVDCMRPATVPASDTGAPFATASTSSMSSDCPSITTPWIIGGMSAGVRPRGKGSGSESAARTTIALPVVVELEVGLRLQGDEEAEREVAVRGLQDRER